MTRSDTRARCAWMRRALAVLAAGMVATPLAPAAGSAQQSLARRIAGVRGEAELRFASRPGVCGNGEGNISFVSPGERSMTTIHGRGGWNYDCEPGPVRVRLSVTDGAVRRVRTYVGQPDASVLPSGVTDLGVVGAREAADYFLGLARSASEQVAQKAIFPASLADSVTVWPQLIELARDRSRPIDVRKPALFWAGQLGEKEVLEPVRAIANDTSEDESLRKHATFVFSQLPDGAGLPTLLDIARDGETTSVRKQALFWAGQGGTSTSELMDLYHQLHEPELERQMIFVISQRDDSAAVDGLIEIARSDPDRSMRKRAFFWLGQKDGPRVIELLISILEK